MNLRPVFEFKPDESKGKLVILGFEMASYIVVCGIILAFLLFIIFWFRKNLV